MFFVEWLPIYAPSLVPTQRLGSFSGHRSACSNSSKNAVEHLLRRLRLFRERLVQPFQCVHRLPQRTIQGGFAVRENEEALAVFGVLTSRKGAAR